VSNKRNKIGLDTIPQEAKSATFNAIPNQVKAEFFNSVISTAFPNFDNLMTASWNVVSIYSNVGTDFPELHKSIVELKSVLQDFEESFGAQVTREEPKLRLDFAPRGAAQDSNSGHTAQPELSASQGSVHNAVVDSDGDTDMQAPQQDTEDGEDGEDGEDNEHGEDTEDSLFVNPEPTPEPVPEPGSQDEHEPEPESESESDDDDEDSDEMPPPRSHQKRPRAPSDDEEQEEESYKPHPRGISVTRVSPSRSASTSRRPGLASSSESHRRTSSFPSPELLRRREEYQQRPIPTPNRAPSGSEEPRPLASIPTAELRAKYKARKAELIQTFGGNSSVPAQYRLQMQELMKEIKKREQQEMGGAQDEAEGSTSGQRSLFLGTPTLSTPTLGNSMLGNSMLGQKKSMGMAPVAPMAHVKKESGGSGVGGAGGAKKN
jgi:hypothetical protein